MLACLPELSPQTYLPHILHHIDRCWPESNCSLDQWIEILNALGVPPEPALAVTAAQDFEGDQFSFTKMGLEDLHFLYGLNVQELALYRPIEDHLEQQIARRRMCLIEVDAFYLPDTGQTAYRRHHSKTTIGINKLDRAHRAMEYFHNGGYFGLKGDDYDCLLRSGDDTGAFLPPYAEFTTLDVVPLEPEELKRRGQALLDRYWARRPRSNPILLFQVALPQQVKALSGQGSQALFDYAFHTCRMVGSNFALLGACLAWLGPGDAQRIGDCAVIAETAKAMPLRLAKAVARSETGTVVAMLEPAVQAWDRLFAT